MSNIIAPFNPNQSSNNQQQHSLTCTCQKQWVFFDYPRLIDVFTYPSQNEIAFDFKHIIGKDKPVS